MTCKFYEDGTWQNEDSLGVCHRYPRISTVEDGCYYIEVYNDTDWCGEWKPIIGATGDRQNTPTRFETLDQ